MAIEKLPVARPSSDDIVISASEYTTLSSTGTVTLSNGLVLTYDTKKIYYVAD